MRVVRILMYEGLPDKLQDQLFRSMPDGSKGGYNGGVTISIVTLPSRFGLWRLVSSIWSLWK